MGHDEVTRDVLRFLGFVRVTARRKVFYVMATDREWDDYELSPTSPVRFNFRRVRGGVRVLLRQASWKLLFQNRISDLKMRLVTEVSGWPGVESGPHRYGGTEFLVSGREIGHIHEWGLLDVPLARPLGDAVVGSGVMGRHHVLPDSGWVSTVVEDRDDLELAGEILRLSYLWHAAKYSCPETNLDEQDVVREVEELGLPEGVKDAFTSSLEKRL